MKPGIYRNLPAAQYHGIKAVSATALKSLSPTPAHGRHKLDNPKDSAALVIGEALHVAVLEPEQWATGWRRAPSFDLRTKQGKADSAAFADRCASEGLRSLDSDDYLTVAAMAKKVHEHPEAAKLLSQAVERELSLVWNDETTGLLCKARIDLLTPRVLVDLKTTRSAVERLFAADAHRLGYHIQLAHYNEGLRFHRMERGEWSIITPENVPPFETAVYGLEEDWQEAGKDDWRERMKTMASCLKTGTWPGYPRETIPLALPAWAAGEDLELTMDGVAV